MRAGGEAAGWEINTITSIICFPRSAQGSNQSACRHLCCSWTTNNLQTWCPAWRLRKHEWHTFKCSWSRVMRWPWFPAALLLLMDFPFNNHTVNPVNRWSNIRLAFCSDCISKTTCGIWTHLDKESSCLDSFPAGIVHRTCVSQMESQVFMWFQLLWHMSLIQGSELLPLEQRNEVKKASKCQTKLLYLWSFSIGYMKKAPFTHATFPSNVPTCFPAGLHVWMGARTNILGNLQQQLPTSRITLLENIYVVMVLTTTATAIHIRSCLMTLNI